MKETVHGSKLFIDCLRQKLDAYHIISTSQGVSKIISLLQGGIYDKGCLLAKSSGSLGTYLAWRILFWVLYDHRLPCPGGRCIQQGPLEEKDREKETEDAKKKAKTNFV